MISISTVFFGDIRPFVGLNPKFALSLVCCVGY
jgi:hypothetical protein